MSKRKHENANELVQNAVQTDLGCPQDPAAHRALVSKKAIKRYRLTPFSFPRPGRSSMPYEVRCPHCGDTVRLTVRGWLSIVREDALMALAIVVGGFFIYSRSHNALGSLIVVAAALYFARNLSSSFGWDIGAAVRIARENPDRKHRLFRPGSAATS